MKCPMCGARCGVSEVRKITYGLRRRRVCSKCPHRFTSYEVTGDKVRRLQYDRIKNKMNDILEEEIRKAVHRTVESLIKSGDYLK